MDVICKVMHTESEELFYVTQENDVKYFVSDDELEEGNKMPYINIDDYEEMLTSCNGGIRCHHCFCYKWCAFWPGTTLSGCACRRIVDDA